MNWKKKEEIVSEIIQHAYLMNVCDICELVDEDMSDDEFDEICESCDHEGKQKMLGTDGRYAPKVLKAVLDELGIKGLDIICSDKCWESIADFCDQSTCYINDRTKSLDLQGIRVCLFYFIKIYGRKYGER